MRIESTSWVSAFCTALTPRLLQVLVGSDNGIVTCFRIKKGEVRSAVVFSSRPRQITVLHRDRCCDRAGIVCCSCHRFWKSLKLETWTTLSRSEFSPFSSCHDNRTFKPRLRKTSSHPPCIPGSWSAALSTKGTRFTSPQRKQSAA